MKAPLPPLNALRAFEAAGRQLSLTKAARELHVTTAAVSHQVKALERHLDVALFRRVGNARLLTEAGQLLLAGLAKGFRELERSVEALSERSARGPLVLSVAPVFAAKWLIPRLAGFQARHPEIDVRVSASLALADFRRDGIDAAVRIGRGRYAGLASDPLFGESVIPVCSPKLLAGRRRLARPSDLARHVLLHFDWPGHEPTAPSWATWLRAAGADAVDATRGPRFTQPDLAMQAAIDGAGVALGWRTVGAADLAAGRLVAPFAHSLALEVSFFLVYPEEKQDSPRLAAFRSWLLEEAALSANAGAPARRRAKRRLKRPR